MNERINYIIEKRVRPYLRSHHGNIVIKDFSDGTLTVELLGQCSTCPSNALATKDFIEKAICQAVPEVKRLELYQPVSQELLDMARKILSL